MNRLALGFAALLLAACSNGKPADRLSDDEALANFSEAELNAGDSFTGQANDSGSNFTAAPAAVPEPGKAGPIIYQAVGTKPGWTLIVRPGRTDYVGDDAEGRIAELTPQDFRPQQGSWRSGSLVVTIGPGPCSDGMSDRTYRDTVNVVASGKTLKGCGGGSLVPDGVDGTRWTVVAVNGRPTPGGADYVLSFAKGQLAARFGCNSIGGPFSQEGGEIVPGGLSQTMIGCPEPAAQFEGEGLAVLTSPMRAQFKGGERMRLVSDAGSIELRRAI